MNDVIIDRDDYQKKLRLQELRSELDAMGYHVIRKDWVRKFGTLAEVSERDRFAGHWTHIKPHILKRMGADLGINILGSGAIVASESNGSHGYELRAEVSIILRDPKFDVPVWANPEYRK